MQNLKKLKKDHLHMCGEYVALVFLRLFKVGSPPHVWRIPKYSDEKAENVRITSTCVENTMLMALLNGKH